jgi:preprotein translocase subunit SecG
MNKAQRTIISIAVPVIIILIGVVLIGYGSSTSDGYGENSGVALNPIKYFSKHGIEWIIVTIVISVFELFLWKTPKEKSE